MFGQEQCLSFTLSLVPDTKDMCLVGHKFKLQQLVQEFHCGASLTLTGASLQLTLTQVFTFLQNVLNPGTVQKLSLCQQIECIFALSTNFLQSALLIISIAAATKPYYSPGKESSRVPIVPGVQNNIAEAVAAVAALQLWEPTHFVILMKHVERREIKLPFFILLGLLACCVFFLFKYSLKFYFFHAR